MYFVRSPIAVRHRVHQERCSHQRNQGNHVQQTSNPQARGRGRSRAICTHTLALEFQGCKSIRSHFRSQEVRAAFARHRPGRHSGRGARCIAGAGDGCDPLQHQHQTIQGSATPRPGSDHIARVPPRGRIGWRQSTTEASRRDHRRQEGASDPDYVQEQPGGQSPDPD